MTARKIITAFALVGASTGLLPSAHPLAHALAHTRAQPPQDQLIRDQLGARDCPAGCEDRARSRQASDAAANRLFNRGLKQLQTMDYNKAGRTFAKAVSRSPDNGVFQYMAGSAFFLAGDHEKARGFLTRSIALGSQDETHGAQAALRITTEQRQIATQMIAEIR